MLNRIRPRPDGACQWGVVSPADSRVVEQVRQGLMLKARVHPLRFATAGVNHLNEFGGRSRTPGVVISIHNPTRILRGEQIADRAWRRSSGNNELVRGKAWPLVGLEHAIAEGVLFSQLEVGVQKPGRIVDILELGIGRRTPN